MNIHWTSALLNHLLYIPILISWLARCPINKLVIEMASSPTDVSNSIQNLYLTIYIVNKNTNLFHVIAEGRIRYGFKVQITLWYSLLYCLERIWHADNFLFILFFTLNVISTKGSKFSAVIGSWIELCLQKVYSKSFMTSNENNKNDKHLLFLTCMIMCMPVKYPVVPFV